MNDGEDPKLTGAVTTSRGGGEKCSVTGKPSAADLGDYYEFLPMLLLVSGGGHFKWREGRNRGMHRLGRAFSPLILRR
jgi:hypothetical protein